jgi:hypothetical protein
LAFARQQPALIEATRQCRFGGAELGTGQRHEATVEQFGRRVRAHAAFEQRRFGPVGVMPHDQRAIALEKHRFGQLGQHLRPGVERTRAETGDQQFGAGSFGQRRQHGSGDPGRGLRARSIAALIERHAMPNTGETPRDQAPAQPAAEHCEIGLSRTVHRAHSGHNGKQR